MGPEVSTLREMAPIPSILYKYLDQSGAKAFLGKPRLCFKDWRKLDDLMEVLPGHRPMSEDEIQQQARIKAQQTRLSIEKCATFVRGLTQIDPVYWERELRRSLEETPATLFICSMTDRWNSGAMWGLYAERHTGMVFGIHAAAINRIRKARAYLEPVVYSEERPQMPIPTIDPSIIKAAIKTKSTDWGPQREWRLISGSGADEALGLADLAELVIGYRSSTEIEGMALSFKASGTRVFRGFSDPQLHQIARKEV